MSLAGPCRVHPSLALIAAGPAQRPSANGFNRSDKVGVVHPNKEERLSTLKVLDCICLKRMISIMQDDLTDLQEDPTTSGCFV